VTTDRGDPDVPAVTGLREWGDTMWVLVVAGVSTGVVVAGIGSRVAMLILRLTSSENVRGVTSDDGFEIGRITVGGTYSLVMLGAAVGIIGAVAYKMVAPWLLGPVWFRRCTVAAGSGAVVGSMLVHADGIDFRLLEPLWLAVGLFVALPAAFGVAISVVVDRLSARPVPQGRRRWLVPVLLIAAFPATIPLTVFVAVGVACWILVRRTLGDRRLPTIAGVVVRVGWLAIAVLGLNALVGDVQALT
jgi:hypothetical protein